MPKKNLYDLWRDLPLPDFIRYWIVRLLFPKFLIGVDAMIFNDQSEYLLFKHSYRKKFPWGFPGGYLKKGESPEEAIKREILEESGLQVKIIELFSAKTSKFMQRVDLVYIGELIGDNKFEPSDEVIEAKFFTLDGLPDLMPEQVEMIMAFQNWIVKNRK